MNRQELAKKKELRMRNQQIDLHRHLRGALDEMNERMLGCDDWDTTKVDVELRELMDDIASYFGDDFTGIENY